MIVAILAVLFSAPPERSTEDLAEALKQSVVVVKTLGREARRQAIGTGFVVADGLIATNWHVIGEARPIEVEFNSGRRYPVTAVHATDRLQDLAVLRIDARDLVPLPLADSDKTRDGQSVVALGSPRGLAFSVVAGVISARREMEGRTMLQLAIPVEEGNSGGPVVDRSGAVLGVLTEKSRINANLGFAICSNALAGMLARPNPTPMSKWLPRGLLDPQEWSPKMGARWTERGGRILVEGTGEGFGGRSICLATKFPPKEPAELAVEVKLDDESGAAGLIFHAGDDGRHYGFYPTAGQLRFTRFGGPDVLSWTILGQTASPEYRAGEWNTLHVRLEKDRFVCSVNGRQVMTISDGELPAGSIGLAKFRETRAEFRNFRCAVKTAAGATSFDRLNALLGDWPPKSVDQPTLLASLAGEAEAGATALRERARLLEREAARLRETAASLHERRVLKELTSEIDKPEAEIDLAYAALLIAKIDNDDLDLAAYRRQLDRMANELRALVPPKAEDAGKLSALQRYLFQEQGFHGARQDYYNRFNSYLSSLLDDREGLPITLAILHLELGRRLGLNLEGVGYPGHFLVRFQPADGEPKLLDVFDGGKTLAADDPLLQAISPAGEPVARRRPAAADKRSILFRLAGNLLGVARRNQDPPAMLRYLEIMIAIKPDAGPERWMRAVARLQLGRRTEALADAAWLLEKQPDGVDLDRVREFYTFVQRTKG